MNIYIIIIYITETTTDDDNSKLNKVSSMIQNNVKRYFDSMNIRENEETDELFARAIFASGSSLSIAEHNDWKVFLNKLRPSYIVPSRYQLSNRLLEAEYNRVEAEVSLKVRESMSIGLQCDGWSNRRNESVINFVLTTPKPVFYKTLASKEEKHTGEYMASQMEEILLEIGPEKFYAIITDNAASMIKARNILHKKYPKIAVYSCAAHTINLFVQDVLKCKSIENLESDCKRIVKDINNSHTLRAKLNRIQKEKSANTVALKLPVKTRWGSIYSCLKSLLDNKYFLKALAVEEGHEKLLGRQSLTSILDEDVFWISVNKMTEIFQPIVKWITILESDEPKLSMVAEAFKEINDMLIKLLPSSTLNKTEELEVIHSLKKRRDMALKPIHFAANILDPKYNGNSLSQVDQICGSEYIHSLVADMENAVQEIIFKQLAEYRAKEGFFSKPYVKAAANKLDAVVWWKGTCYGTELGQLAAKILTMPASTAATERSFSTYGIVHSAKRNRLTVERAGKLTYISHNLKLLRNGGRKYPIEVETAENADTLNENDDVISGSSSTEPSMTSESDSD
jgi:hypothetical protein